jgi:paraquat-inducible protein A
MSDGSELSEAAARLRDCPTCGLVQSVGPLVEGARAHCARCDGLIARHEADGGTERALCYTLTALLLFLPAYAYPILEVTTFGNTRSYTVLSGARALWQSAMWPLAVPVALASVVLPLCLILTLLALVSARALGKPEAVPRLRRIGVFLATWSIVDVYLLAIFVTVVKLAQMTAPCSSSAWSWPWRSPCAACTWIGRSPVRRTPAQAMAARPGCPIPRARTARSR